MPVDKFVIRHSGSADTVIPLVRRAVIEVNRNLPIDEVVSLSEQVGRSLVQQKLVARLASFFSLLALLLACIGLYGVLSYAVARRTNEIGIRMPLGARHRDVIWLVLREALALVGAGVVIGLLASFAATKTVSTLLFGLKPNDPLTIAGATLLLLAVAAIGLSARAQSIARRSVGCITRGVSAIRSFDRTSLRTIFSLVIIAKDDNSENYGGDLIHTAIRRSIHFPPAVLLLLLQPLQRPMTNRADRSEAGQQDV
jgi:FtsX-like permease family protein